MGSGEIQKTPESALTAEVSVKSDTGRPNAYWYENGIFFDRLKKTEIGKRALEQGYRENQILRKLLQANIR